MVIPSRRASSDTAVVENILCNTCIWDEDQEKACVEAANKEVDDAMQEVESQPTQTVTELMQNEYVVTPPAIQKELDAYQAKEAK